MANQTFIVGDAGGTGTQWRLVDDGSISQFETIGFNAYTHSIEDLKQSIVDTFGSKILPNIPTFFYAAGIDTAKQAVDVKQALEELFGERVYAHNDLIGVARSLCGKEAGNVCILGTGANACFYDGENVNKVSASLGYVLGDEGSGAHLGKKLLKAVFRNQVAEEVITAFQSQFNLTSDQVIRRIYDQPKPNHFLASFAPFVFENSHYPDVHEMIQSNFIDFFDAFFFENHHSKAPFYFSGSIALHFSDVLRQEGADRGITIKNIVQSPISGLVLYHQQND
ncbi:N-acetylglucosamine kinase [Ekhidna sp. To15]|uniref:N-acetylglucosamine kinase n=1 Tax=Ekhidna sp. To15 TaxID=3395267 RepID=UPI003F522177